jgi:hypothetical protein
MALKSALEIQFQADDEQIRDMRAFRNMEQPIGLPKEMLVAEGLEVRDPTARDEIARVIATMTKYEPTIRCAPAVPTDTGYEAATRVERWTAETIKAASSRMPGLNAMYMLWDALLADGGCWAKVLHLPDTWEERYGIKLDRYLKDGRSEEQWDEDTETAKKRAGVPFIIEPADALTVYPVWEGIKLAGVLEWQHRTRLPRWADRQRDRFGPPLSRDEANGSGSADIECFEYWTEEWRTYLCSHQGQLYFDQARHRYGRPPYFVALGIPQNEWRGRKVGHGVSHNKRPFVDMRSKLLTLALNDAVRWANPPMGIETPETAEAILGDDGQRLEFKEIEFRQGGIYRLAPGEKWMPFPSQSVSPSIRQMLDMIVAMESALDTPRVQSNISGAAAGAGFAVSQMLAEAKTKHDPFVKAMQQMLTEIVQFIWHLTRTQVKEKVWVSTLSGAGSMQRTQWLGVGEDDLRQIVGVRVIIDPTDPAGQLVEMRTYKEMVAAGFLSRDQAIEALGYNPDEVRLGIALDQMRNEDWYKAYRNKLVLQTLGRGDLLKQAADAAAQTGILPGMPPELVQQIQQQRQLAAAQQASNPPQAPGPNMPAGQTSPTMDLGAMHMGPNGAGAAPGGMPGPPNGAVQGAGPGAVVPQQAAVAGMAGVQGGM